MLEKLNNSQLSVLADLISALKSVESSNTLNHGYSNYYNNLCKWLEWLIRKSHKNKISGRNIGFLFDFSVQSINEFSVYLLKYSETLFKKTQRLDIIDITLDKLEQFLECFNLIEEYRFEEYHMTSIFNYLQFSLKTGNVWCDITIIKKVLQICEYLVKSGVSLHYLSKVLYDGENIMLCKFSFTIFYEDFLEQYNYVYQFYQCEKQKEVKSKMNNVKIGIITALPKEFAAMEILLSNCIEQSFEGKGAGHHYVIGEVQASNGTVIPIALGMCGMGNNQASIRATNMMNHFPELDVIIMTGIAGGIPDVENVEEHVRLGDIIVSEGIIQYDFIKDTPEGIICRSTPPKPSAKAIEAVNLLRKGEYLGMRKWEAYIDEIINNFSKFKKPPIDTDILYDESDNIIQHPFDMDRSSYPKVFFGKIGSANTLLKNPKTRAYIKKKYGVNAVEMEVSGIADATWNNAIGYITIRGICDYGDAHKINLWQEYAAAVAAAYTRTVIEMLTY